MKVLSSKLSKAKKLKGAQGSDKSLSKVCNLNGSHRLFFPTDEDGDLTVAVVPGCKTDWEKTGTGFVVFGEEDYEQIETGKIINKSGLKSLSKIARAVHKAAMAYDIKRAEKEARETAEASGRVLDILALEQAKKEIELKYEGDIDKKPNPIYPEVQQAIGGVTLLIATECLVIPLDSESRPNWSKAELASVDLSGKKVVQIETLLAKKEYFNVGDGFLEVQYDYNGTDAKQAGINAAFGGVAKSVSLTVDSDLWEANKTNLERLARDGEAIAARNRSMSSPMKPADVAVKYKKWLAKNDVLLTNLDYDSEEVKNAAKDFIAEGIVATMPKIQENLLAIIAANTKEGVVEHITTNIEELGEIREEVVQAAGAKTLSELKDAVDGTDIDDISVTIEEDIEKI